MISGGNRHLSQANFVTKRRELAKAVASVAIGIKLSLIGVSKRYG
jgi:hypothetical protein